MAALQRMPMHGNAPAPTQPHQGGWHRWTCRGGRVGQGGSRRSGTDLTLQDGASGGCLRNQASWARRHSAWLTLPSGSRGRARKAARARSRSLAVSRCSNEFCKVQRAGWVLAGAPGAPYHAMPQRRGLRGIISHLQAHGASGRVWQVRVPEAPRECLSPIRMHPLAHRRLHSSMLTVTLCTREHTTQAWKGTPVPTPPHPRMGSRCR